MNIVASYSFIVSFCRSKRAIHAFLATLFRPLPFLPIRNPYKPFQALPFLETAQLRGMLAKPPADGFERDMKEVCQSYHESEGKSSYDLDTANTEESEKRGQVYQDKHNKRGWLVR